MTMSTIVEFRAGKLDWDGKMCTPDKRKGKLSLVKDAEDLHHVIWFDREKNEKIDDLVVVNDAYLERVTKVTTGRVYVLKYTSSKLRVFFWMQEPQDEKDNELVKKFNDAIGAEIPSKNQPVSQAALASALTGAASATGSGAGAAAGAGSNAALQAQLLAMLQGAGAAGMPGGAMLQRGPQVSLTHILKNDVLMQLATDSEALKELKTHMPGDQQEDNDVLETLRSAQLKQNMSVLSQAIYSDQLPILWRMLDLPGGPTPGEDPMESLCKALTQKHGS